MGNFASTAFVPRDAQHVRIGAPAAAVSTPRLLLDSFKTAISSFYNDMVSSFSGSSVVIAQLDEVWYQDLLGEVNAMKARSEHAAAAPAVFLGPSDTVVASIDSLKFPVYSAKPWRKSASNEDDDTSSCTTEETDDESKFDYSDCEVSECEASEFGDDDDEQHHAADESCCCAAMQPEEVEYYNEDDDTETKADRLLRLASMNSHDVAPVYVEDYLCPCGECPQYERIACDVRATVTWRGVKEQGSIIRVLQAFSTYNEVIGYHPDMIEAAEECLQLWLGDEDRALNSFVMLFDEVPQLCAGDM